MADYLGKKIKFNIEDNDLQKKRFNKAYGESQQATRSGKNLFDKDNANIINTYIAGSGNGVLPSDGGAENKCVYIPCKQNTTYTIQKMIGKRFGVAYTYETPAQGVMAYNKTVDNNVASITITTDSSAKYLVVYLRNGNASGEITLQQALDSLQIEKGSTATDYEPYGVMPSPDYRSKIENLEGRNILQNKQKTQTINGVTFTVNKDKSVTLSGTATADTNYYFYTTSNYLTLKKGNYTLSGVKGDSTTSYKMLIYKTDWTFIGQDIGNGLTFTLEEDANVFIYIWVKNGITVKTTVYPQLEEGTVATPYVPYNSLEFKDEGKNKFDCANSRIIYNNSNAASYERLENGLKLISGGSQYSMIYFLVDTVKNLKDKTLTLSSDISFSKDNQLTTLGLFYTDINGGNRTTLVTNNNVTSEGKYQVTGQVEEGENRDYVCIGLRPNMASNYASGDYTIYDNLQVEIGEIATPYTPYQERKEYFPLAEGQKLYKGSYLADDGIHHKRKQVVLDGTENWVLEGVNAYTKMSDARGTINSIVISNQFKYEVNASIWGQIRFGKTNNNLIFYDVITGKGSLAGFKAYLSEQYANGTPVIVEYELAEEEIVPYTETQKEARKKLRSFKGLNGENNITAQGTMTSTLDLTLYNVAEEDFDIYISKKGYFRALKYDINNLIDFMESNIPSIAEATESSVKIAGRDGDISLNTVYEPLPFEIVCYTEDNLTPEEKIIEEQKITSLLNSIKNQTKTLFMEREKKFYKVKYSGNLSVVRYPKHLKFTIPLKSSESYAMNFEESEIIGNGTKVSNTIKDTGAIFTIKGPAIKPIISLNNYQMEYNENILEGNSLIINSEDSTITHITSAGVKTNAMRAYNHEFPKIKNGENQLAVSSGIDDEKQVNVKWYDLKI